MRARDVMSSPVITVTPDCCVKEAADLLASKGFTALPVVNDDDRLIGIVTETDVMRDQFPRHPTYRNDAHDSPLPPHRPAATVGEVMTTSVIGMGAGTTVVDLVTAMLDDNVRAMPIVDGSRIVGIVTRRDLLRFLPNAFRSSAAEYSELQRGGVL